MSSIDIRRSVRKYNDKVIDKDTLIKLCEAGFLAPSARNQDSRAFIIIDDEKVISLLSTISMGAKVLENAKCAIAVIGINSDKVPTPRMMDQDLAASTQNILLKATELNIGSCWIGVHPIEERSNLAKEILNVKGNDYVFSIIALGYIDDDSIFYRRQDKIKYDHIYANGMK